MLLDARAPPPRRTTPPAEEAAPPPQEEQDASPDCPAESVDSVGDAHVPMATATVHLGDVDATTTTSAMTTPTDGGGRGSTCSQPPNEERHLDEKKVGEADDAENEEGPEQARSNQQTPLLSTRVAVAPAPSPPPRGNPDAGGASPLFGTSSPSSSENSVPPCLKVACQKVHELLVQVVSKDDPTSGEDDHHATRHCDDGHHIRNSNDDRFDPSLRAGRRGRLQLPTTSQQQQLRTCASSSPTPGSPTELISPTASSFESDTSSLAGFFADYNITRKSSAAPDRKRQGKEAKLTSSSILLDSRKIAEGLAGAEETTTDALPGAPSAPRRNVTALIPTARVGHKDLVSLCSWTLEQIGGESPVLISPRSLSAAVERGVQPPQGGGGDEECDDHSGKPDLQLPSKYLSRQISSGTAPPAASETAGSRRTTMFASEYARRLSTSSSFAVETTPGVSSTGGGAKGRLKTLRKNNPRSTSRPATPASSSGKVPLLHQADPQVQSGAVLDLVATAGENTAPPSGYYRIEPGIPVSVAAGGAIGVGGTGSTTVYLNVKKEVNWDKAAQRPVLTSISVLHTPSDFVPPGYCVVKSHQTKLPAKLGNAHIVFKRSREGNPLTDIVLLEPPSPIPAGYTVVERTPRNHVATVGGVRSLFIGYRQRLANLEALRPVPLIRAAQPKAGADFVDDSSDDDSYHQENLRNGSVKGCLHSQLHHSHPPRRRVTVDPPLLAYYATGATTVASRVGRFHILDRSTHSLLSPSSVQHRLALVQLSRTSSNDSIASQLAHALDFDPDRNYDDDTQVLVETGGASRSHATTADRCDGPSSMRGMTMLSHFFKLSLQEPSHAHVQSCWDALSFIPVVETYGNAWLLQERMVAITPLLTACYTRHGGAARVAVQSLTSLLLATDFFSDDVFDNQRCRAGIPGLTLLDMATQCVCDVATTSCCEVILADCVEFVQGAMNATQGYLSQRTLGYVLRFYLFVFYFGASTCTNCEWPNPLWQLSSRPAMLASQQHSPASEEAELDVGILTDPRAPGSSETYLPGGAPQAAALALKEFLHWILLRLGKTCILQQLANSPARDIPEHEEIGVFLSTIFNGVLETAVENVERANYTQLAYYQIHRSGGSELFWHDMITTCAPGLFRSDADGIHAVAFSVLANLVKVALGKVRTDRNLLHSRDMASKLLSLELLLYFLELYADEQEALENQKNYELVFSVRRMLVPCLLTNTRSALEDPQVYLRILRISSELWLSPLYRQQCRVEIGILMEHFLLHVLQMRPQAIASSRLDIWHEAANTSLLSQQVLALREVKLWCADPKDVIEFFLNYDTDICMNGPVQLVPGTRWKLFQRICTSLTNIAELCGERIGQEIQESRNLEHKTLEHGEAAQLLRTTSLETISQIVRSLAVAAAASCTTTDKFSRLVVSWNPGEPPFALSPSKSSKSGGDKQILGFWREAIAAEQQDRFSTVAPTPQETRQIALEIAKQKSLKKAIDYLIACNSLSPSPRDIANFLRIHKDELDPVSLGEYLSETGVGAETEWWKSIRHLYVRAISFVGMKVEEGLRHFLTNCGFRLPGEAQRIDRIMSTFAKCYFEDNAGDSLQCPFKYEDTVYLVAFAIIMLNTDLHKSATKPRKKMTKSEFIGNLRGAEQGEDISKEYLIKIFESIESNPIALDTDSSLSSELRPTHIQDMLNNVRNADTLLRGLAVHDFQFATIEDFRDGLDYKPEEALADLTRCCVAKTWHQWHGVINTCLETAHLDPLGMGPSLDILLFALTLTVCLDMPTERAAFLSQLGRLKAFEERRQGRYVTAGEPDASIADWFRELENGCCGSEQRKLQSLQQIHDWITALKSALLDDAQNKITMQAVVRQLKDCDSLLQDPARAFRRAGNLLKKSARTGRSITYRFYLFSDVLLYAKQDPDGRFVVHEELPLHLLKVVDWFPPSNKNRKVMFEVSHPRKSFFVLCSSAKERKSWVKDIKGAVQLEMDRKMKIEAARLAARR